MADQSSVSSPASSAQPASPKPRKRRRWPWILLGILAFGLILIALLPTIFSTGPFRRMALRRVNEQLNGKAEVESWSLGWFSGFKLNGVRLADAQGATVAEVKSITLPASVPALLRSTKRIGTLEIEGLKADIVLYPDGTNNLTKLIKQPAAPPPAKEAGPLGFDLAGAVAVRNGEIAVHPAFSTGSGQAGEAKPFLIRDLSADVKIESLDKPIQLDLQAAFAGEQNASLAVNASATLLRNGTFDPNAVEADVTVKLDGLDLGPLSELARQCGAPISAAGKLAVAVRAHVKGHDSFAAAGAVSVQHLILSGGPLGKDQLKFDQAALNFDAAKSGQALTIKEFKLTSPICTANASGSLEPQAGGNMPKGRLAAHAELNLAALAAQLPDTLKLQKGLAIEGGTVVLDSSLASDEKGRRLDAGVRLENLAAVRDGKRIALDAPIALLIKASQTDKGARLDKLELTSSFAAAQGSGSLEKFDLEITSDLAAAMREAGKFIDLPGKTAQGQAKLTLSVSGADARQKTISGALTLNGLALTGFTPRPVGIPAAKATLNALALLDQDGSLRGLSGLKINLAAPFADAAISAEAVAFAPGKTLPTIQDGKLAVNADLGDAARFASNAGLIPANVGLDGKLSFSAALALEKDTVRLPEITAGVTGFALTGFTPGPIRLAKAKATLAATAFLDERGALQKLGGLKLDFAADKIAAGGMTAESLAFAPGQALPTLANASVSLEADLAEAARFAREANLMPAAIALAGKLSCSSGLAADKGVLRLNQIIATVADMDVSQVVAQGEQQITRHVREPKITLAGSAEANPAARSAAIHGLVCRASAGTLTLQSLEVPDWAAAPAGISAALNGELDIERLLLSLKDFAPLPEGTKVAGRAGFALKAATAAAAQQVAVQAEADVDGLKVASAEGRTVQEDKIKLTAAAVIAPSAGSVSLNSMTISSGLFTLTAKGALADWSQSRDLTADGSLECNWDRIGPLAAAFSGQPIEMSGKDSREFHVVRLSLGGKDLRAILAKTDAVAGLSIARLKVMGVELTGLSALVTVKDNAPSARLEGGVNGGRLLAPARVDWSKLLPELVLPPDTVVLKDAKLTSEMANAALSRVSPIFKGCTAAGGTVSLDSHLLDVQLGRAVNVGKSILKRASFEGGLTFNNVSMQSGGLLQSVLELAGGGRQLLSLPNQRVALSLKDGRVIQGPMEIAAGNYRFKVSGSVGLGDKTIDFAAALPITRAMAGNRDDVYQLLKDEVVTVSVKGTTDQPEIGKDAFADNVKRLTAAAAKKLIEQEGGKLLQKGLQNLFK